MMLGSRRIQIGSAGYVFAAAAVGWFFGIWSILKSFTPLPGQEGAPFRVSVYSTLPFVAITLASIVVYNVKQSNLMAWVVAIGLSLVVLLVYLVIVVRATVSYS